MSDNSSEAVARRHQLRIARDTLKLTESGELILGGMTHDEARAILEEENRRQAGLPPRRSKR